MSSKLTRLAYEKLVAEDIEWLKKNAPDCLEREHILMILKCSPDHEYRDSSGTLLITFDANEQAMRKVNKQLLNREDVSMLCPGRLTNDEEEHYGIKEGPSFVQGYFLLRVRDQMRMLKEDLRTLEGVNKVIELEYK